MKVIDEYFLQIVIVDSNPVFVLRKGKARASSLGMYNNLSHYQTTVIWR